MGARIQIRGAWLARAWLVAALAAAFAPRAIAQGPGSPRERWDKLSHEERERLRQRFDEFQRMGPEERRAVVERFERMRAVELGAREQLSNDAKRDLSALEPRAQRDAMRGLVERELAERGRAMRELLPREWREKLERAAPAERESVLAQFREHVRRDRLEHVLRDLARRLELEPAEVERIRGLPPPDKEREVFALERRAIERDVESRGLPPAVTREEWDAWRALDTPRFIELWHARMRQLGFPPPRGPRGEPRRRPDGPPGRRPDPERVHELLERLRPDPQWFSELAGLDPRARRDAIESRLRERALEVLARSPDLASPEQLERLRTLTGREFLDAVHDHLREVAPPPFPPFGGPGGQRPPPPRGGPHPPPGGPPPGDGPPHHPPPGPPPHERPID